MINWDMRVAVCEGRVEIAAGYDGKFGTIHIFTDQERAHSEGQLALF